jgi:RNA polymerase sigma-70 factor, ECF subfamily
MRMERESLDTQTDEALMQLLLQSQRHDAFAVLVRRHADRFRQIAFRHIGIREEAEDIVQQAFLKLWDRPALWNTGHKAHFTTWFYRVVVNACMDYHRRQRTVPIAEGQEFEDHALRQDETAELQERQAFVEQAFRSLPRDMQLSLNLSFYDPIPNKDAAAIMGMSLKAFQSLLMRAKRTLQQKLAVYEDKDARRYYG